MTRLDERHLHDLEEEGNWEAYYSYKKSCEEREIDWYKSDAGGMRWGS